MEAIGFDVFRFPPVIAAGIRAAGYTIPKPLQAQAIPLIMQGKDVIGLGPDGAGKTAALVISILNRLSPGTRGSARALVLSPSAETAERTCDIIKRLGDKTGLQCAAIYGESGSAFQTKELQKKPEIIVGGPNRILDCLWKNKLNLSDLEILGIDEADRMFGLGYWPDIFNILACLMGKRQNLVFSATMPENLRRLSRQFLQDPVTVTAGAPNQGAARQKPINTVSKPAVPAPPVSKTALLKEVTAKIKADSILVFTRTRQSAKRVARQLTAAGYQVAAFRGSLSKYQKSAAFQGLPAGIVIILVVFRDGSQSADVAGIFRLINDVETDGTDTGGRHIGRTGRQDQNGDTLTLVTSAGRGNILALEQLLDTPLELFTL